MSMIFRGPVLAAMAAAGLTVGLSLAVPAAASAAATPSAAPGPWDDAPAASTGPSPDIDVFNFFEFSGSGETGTAASTPCNKNATAPGGLSTVLSVDNKCEFRVFLQYANHGPDCVNPHTIRNIVDAADQHPDGARIGTSEAACTS